MASAGMPCSAAALVTSGSFAAPSSIEYSVCTCRCTNESDAGRPVLLLTGGRAPQRSYVPAGGGSGGRPAGKTGVRGCRSILAPGPVYAEGLTERVSPDGTLPSPETPGAQEAGLRRPTGCPRAAPARGPAGSAGR